jgi:ribosome-associated protein
LGVDTVMKIPQTENLLSELVFTTSRSSGPGGQNVNKVNSKVTLKLDVINSSKLSGEEKELIMKKLATKITKEGVLVLTSQDKRSQLQNKEEVLQRFDQLLRKAFTPKKSRKATKPTKASRQNRINEKKQRSEKKQWRQKP